MLLKQGLLFLNGTQITSYSPIEPTKGSHKNISPSVLKLQLGLNCNFSCSYCLQTPTKETKSNWDFLKNLNISELQKVELWGGEPFLYFDEILEIIPLFKKSLIFTIVTNGSLLTPEKIHKLDSLGQKISITVSHDGPNQEKLRNKLNEDMLVAVWKTIENSNNIEMGLNCMISNQNMNYIEIEKYFTKLFNTTKIPLFFDFIEPHDLLSFRHVVEDLKQYENNLKDYIRFSKTSNVKNSIYHLGETSIIGLIKSLEDPYNFRDYGDYKCSIDDPRIVTLDSKGQVKSCQNSSKVIGSSILDSNLNSIELTKFSACDECEVNFICRGVCPYIQKTDHFEKYCAVKKVFGNVIREEILSQLREII
jgi:uncharacterized protein